MRFLACTLLAALFASSPAQAGEVFGGLYAHAVDTPLSLDSEYEGGADVQLGYRFGALGGTGLEPYLFAAANTSGDTSYAAAGISYKFGRRIYVRPGLGLAVHTGSTAKFTTGRDIDFGSRVLFEPEISLGAQLNDRLSVEASWVHMSHATLFSGQNPGIDNVGVRLNWRL